MLKHIGLITLVVRDYDEAIDFYTRVLNFKLIADEPRPGKRWVVVAPQPSGTGLLLAKASNEAQAASIGNQTGGRVFLFLHTDNFDEDYKNFLDAGVKFLEEPRSEAYGKVAVFEDLYGNKWDLLERI